MKPSIDPEILARHTGDRVASNNLYRPWDIDYIHASRKIHCVRETASYLYGAYTPKRTRYVRGSRPELEWHVEVALKNARTRAGKAAALLRHVNRVVLHTMYVPPELHELGGTEEHILRRGFGYCNESARVLVMLAQIAGLPARLLFVRLRGGSRHVMTEILTGKKWGFFDPSFNLCLPVGRAFASALDVQRSKRLQEHLCRLAAENRKYKETLGKRGTPYSEYFHAFALLNYSHEDFPYGVLRPRA